MDKKALNWLSQAAHYGLATTNCSHDINNALAILMGYAENLEYMIEANEVNIEELQETCDKILFGINKLNNFSRDYASERKRDASTRKNIDFSDFIHRWVKVMTPQFNKHNYSPNFISGDELYIDLDWNKANEELCLLFSTIFCHSAEEANRRLDIQTNHSQNGLLLSLKGLQQWNLEGEGLSFLNQNIDFTYEENCLKMLFTCFSDTTSSESAA